MPHRINNDGSKANRRNVGYFRESGSTAPDDGEGKEQNISISIKCESAANSRRLSFLHPSSSRLFENCYASAVAGKIEELPDHVRCENMCLQNNTKMYYNVNHYEELP
jgi:hypothetical protein